MKHIILCIIFLITALTTPLLAQNKGKKGSSNSFLGKVYQNTTAKYNGYFNAQLKLDEGIQTLTDQHQDNYNQILDMYKYMAVTDAKSAAAALDIAITKAAVDIKLHPRSDFADDCYLLIGQSQYVKRDFENAQKTFEFIITAYDPKNKNSPVNKPLTAKEKKKAREKAAKEKKKAREAAKKAKAQEREIIKEAKAKAREARKKGNRDASYEDFMPKKEEEAADEKGEKPKKYLLKHRPIRQDAMIWLARTLIERAKYDEAKVWISRLQEDKTLVKSLKGELAAINAYYYLMQKDYASAIQPLEDAIQLAKRRKDKVRYAYILAQIYQMKGQQQEAFAAFERVIKLRPAYEMEFSARLSMIKNTYSDDPVALANAEKQLLKMLKDEKNEEYWDQIYFTLADISFAAEAPKKAIAYLKKSVFYNVGNKGQKAEAYLKLADTFFEQEEYVNAKNYYDSTLTVLDNKDSRYDLAETRSKSLTDIAQNIKTIALQDSFLNIKALVDAKDEAAYLAIAQSIKDQQPKRGGKKMNKKNRGGVVASRRPSIGGGAARAASATKNKKVETFWAYQNTDRGKRDFQKLWGSDRKLTDNWRRSSSINTGSEVEIVAVEVEEIPELTSQEAIALFKKIGVPMDDAAAKKSGEKVIDAMAALGTLYRERLNNIEKSIDILEQLTKRFPDNKYKLESLYALYIQHQQLGNTREANIYRTRILKEGQNTKFAKAIENPNFLASEKQRETDLQKYYDDAYAQFKAGKYSDARNKVDAVGKQFGNDYAMKPKFALLGAMCTGGIDGVDAYKLSLNEIISKHKETPEAEKAAEILKVLNGETATAKPSRPTSSPTSKSGTDAETGFSLNAGSSHYVAVLYDPKKIKQTDAVASVADYNKKYHRLMRLRTSKFLISIEEPLVLIRRFRDRDEAMKYVNEVKKSSVDYLGVEDETFKVIAINQENYKIVVRERSKWKTYLEFFDREYN